MANSFFGGNKLLDSYYILERAGIKEGDKIADLGCGAAGHFSLSAGSIVGDKGAVFAVDILKNALNNVKKLAKENKINNVHTIWSNIEKYGATNIADGYINFVLLINVLFQSMKHLEILKEAVRLLDENGKIIVIDWKQIKTPLGPPLHMRVRKEDIKAMLTYLHLEEVDSFDAGKYHFGLIFSR